MKPLDKVLQHWRIIKASKWIPEGARVLDFGCHQGELFNRLQNTIGFSLGFDPLVRTNSQANAILLPWIFSEPMPLASASFDVITLLATFEHLSQKNSVARECYRLLIPGGTVVITVPSLAVDRILSILIKLRLLDGMSIGEHHGFVHSQTTQIFEEQGFGLIEHQKFQIGFNHLYVFNKIANGMKRNRGHDLIEH